MNLDQLVIELVLDPKKLTQGQQQAIASFKKTQEDAKRIAASLEEAGRHIVDTLHKIRNEFVGFTAAALEAAGVKEFFSRITQSDADLGRFARSLGISAEELSVWQRAIDLAGGSAADADLAIGSLVEQVQLMRIDPSQATHMLTFLRALSGASGVNFAKELSDVDAGKVGSITNLILKIAQAGGGRNVALMTTFFRQMGFPPGFIQALTRGEGALRAYLDQAQRIGPTTREDVEAAQRFEFAWKQLSAALTRFGHNLVTVWGPRIAQLLDLLTSKAEQLGIVLLSTGIGAAAGSFIPGVGTVAGGLFGFLAGLGGAGILGATKKRVGVTPIMPSAATGGIVPGGADIDSRLNALMKSMPPGMSFSVTSGDRTYAEQSRLYANRGTNPYPVAPPGMSSHEQAGRARDLRFSSPAAEAWAHAHGGEFGLTFPVPNDPIHVEMAKRYSAMAGARTSMPAGRTSNTNVDSDVNIQNVNINAPNATNAQGIAREFGPFLNAHQRRALALSANGGAN